MGICDDCLPDQNVDLHGRDSGKQATAASFLGGRGFPRLKSVESGKRNKDGKAWWNVRLGDGREKRLQMVINKIASATHGSLTSLVRSALLTGRDGAVGAVCSCLSSQSSPSVWWGSQFLTQVRGLWSPTDFGTRHDIKQEPLTQKKNRHLKGAETDSLTSDFLLIWSVSGTQNSHFSSILCCNNSYDNMKCNNYHDNNSDNYSFQIMYFKQLTFMTGFLAQVHIYALYI